MAGTMLIVEPFQLYYGESIYTDTSFPMLNNFSLKLNLVSYILTKATFHWSSGFESHNLEMIERRKLERQIMADIIINANLILEGSTVDRDKLA